MKLYRALEGKFILLQDEIDEDNEDGDQEDTGSSISDNSALTTNSDEPSDDAEDVEPLDSRQILTNKKACTSFGGLYRSKGIFWLATRPNQMGSWSTAGAMLTLGSEMPWFCNTVEDQWNADEETVTNIKADFKGEWGDRRQELVLIGEKLDEDGLTRVLDGCLLSKGEMRKWEKVMHDKKLDEEEQEEKLQGMWDDSYWAEWPRVDSEEDHKEHDDDHHHSHKH